MFHSLLNTTNADDNLICAEHQKAGDECKFAKRMAKLLAPRTSVLQIVSLKTNQRLEYSSKVATDPESTPAGFCVFSDSDPETQIREKPDPEQLFTFGSRSLRGLYVTA